MNGDRGQDDLRERVAALLASPWTPVAAAFAFLLAILFALLTVFFNSRTEGQQDA